MKLFKELIIIYVREVLFWLAIIFGSAIGIFVQFLGKKSEGDFAGVIFAGTSYKINYFFYLLGFLVFVAVFMLSFRFIILNNYPKLFKYSLICRILYWALTPVYAYLMVGVDVVMVFIQSPHFGDIINPEALVLFSSFGFPILCFVHNVINFIIFEVNKDKILGEL